VPDLDLGRPEPHKVWRPCVTKLHRTLKHNNAFSLFNNKGVNVKYSTHFKMNGLLVIIIIGYIFVVQFA